jgi:hypothetical protein
MPIIPVNRINHAESPVLATYNQRPSQGAVSLVPRPTKRQRELVARSIGYDEAVRAGRALRGG